MPPLLDVDGVAKKCDRIVLQGTQEVLSFLPVFAGIKFGAYPVFIINSIVSAGMDLIFVIMQRYNRQRIMKILAAKSKNASHLDKQ